MKKFPFCDVRVGFLLLLAAFLRPSYCASGPEGLEGYYSSPSKRCTIFSQAKDDFVSCEKEFSDCLLLKKISDKKFAVEIFSTQATQHVCALKGVAVVEKEGLTVRFGEGPSKQRIHFIKKSDDIVLKHRSPPNQIPENCGAHASFDGLRFKKVDSDVAKHVCFEE